MLFHVDRCSYELSVIDLFVSMEVNLINYLSNFSFSQAHIAFTHCFTKLINADESRLIHIHLFKLFSHFVNLIWVEKLCKQVFSCLLKQGLRLELFHFVYDFWVEILSFQIQLLRIRSIA